MKKIYLAILAIIFGNACTVGVGLGTSFGFGRGASIVSVKPSVSTVVSKNIIDKEEEKVNEEKIEKKDENDLDKKEISKTKKNTKNLNIKKVDSVETKKRLKQERQS